jgi:ketosteroid isomerase-like protein
MKSLLFPLLLIFILVAGCKSPKADTDSTKKEISNLISKNLNAMQSHDIETVAALMDDNGLYCGTDPGEFWTKKQVCSEYKKMFADTTIHFADISSHKQEIRVSKDGKSAIVIDQWSMNGVGIKVPIRMVYHFVKEKDKWITDFSSVGLIPYNKDIPKLNKAVE